MSKRVHEDDESEPNKRPRVDDDAEGQQRHDRKEKKDKTKGKQKNKEKLGVPGGMKAYLNEKGDDGKSLNDFLADLSRTVVSKEAEKLKNANKKPKPQSSNSSQYPSNAPRVPQEGDGIPSTARTEAPETSRPKLLPSHPFQSEDDDHCETPKTAYEDIAPFLTQIALISGKSKSTLRIYDPYFCAGSMKRNLAELGFTNVYNENEDFYAVTDAGRNPEFDILITNPPYSEDHIEKCLSFAVSCGKPWFLLVPTFVYTKDYYLPTLKGAWPVYITPTKRYNYWSPNRKAETSPFVSFWYVDFGKHRERLMAWWNQTKSQYPNIALTLNTWKLPENMKDSNDDTRVRLRKNQLDAIKKKQAAGGDGGGGGSHGGGSGHSRGSFESRDRGGFGGGRGGFGGRGGGGFGGNRGDAFGGSRGGGFGGRGRGGSRGGGGHSHSH